MVERLYTVETLDPGNPKSDKVRVKFPEALVERWKHREIVRFYNIETAVKVLKAPRRIFYNTRPLSQGWWCYVGKPDIWYKGERITATFPENMVFAVLINSDFEVYGFRGEFSASDDPLSPKDWQTRYGQLIWKT